MSLSLPGALALILVLGIGAQWLSWRLRLPGILLLLLFGLAAGPLSGILDPDALFGELLFPIVSLSVGIILFEGGLSLRFRELKDTAGAVRNLIFVGSTITWAGGSFLAWALLGMPFRLALLLGAILVVTGPTVVLPLLRQVRPSGQVGTVLKWEGILIDPLGATLASWPLRPTANPIPSQPSTSAKYSAAPKSTNSAPSPTAQASPVRLPQVCTDASSSARPLYGEIEALSKRGATIKKTPLTDEYDFQIYQEQNATGCIPILLINDANVITMFTKADTPKPKSGDYIVSLVLEAR